MRVIGLGIGGLDDLQSLFGGKDILGDVINELIIESVLNLTAEFAISEADERLVQDDIKNLVIKWAADGMAPPDPARLKSGGKEMLKDNPEFAKAITDLSKAMYLSWCLGQKAGVLGLMVQNNKMFNASRELLSIAFSGGVDGAVKSVRQARKEKAQKAKENTDGQERGSEGHGSSGGDAAPTEGTEVKSGEAS